MSTIPPQSSTHGVATGHSAKLECRSEMYCTRLAENTGRKKSPSRHHRTTLWSCIFVIKACIDNRKKLLNSNTSSKSPDNMVKFGPLTAEMGSLVCAPLQISTGSRLGSLTARQSSSGRQPNFVVLKRGRHLYSTGRPSRWALAYILDDNFLGQN